MHILITTSTFPRWSGDTLPGFVFSLAKYLISRGTSLDVIAPHAHGSKKKEILETVPVRRYRYFWPDTWEKLCYGEGIVNNLRKNFLFLFQVPFLLIAQFLIVTSSIKNKKDYLINAHWIFPQGFIAALYRKFFRIPVVLSVHGGDIFYRQKGFYKILVQYTLKNVDAILCVSTAIKQEISREFPQLKNKIHVVSMGIDPDFFTPLKKNASLKKKLNADPLLIYVGRLSEKKGIEYAVNAFPSVLEKFPSAKFVIIGYGAQEKRLKEITESLLLGKNVLFLGEKTPEEIAEFLASADIFVGPSVIAQDGNREGLPVSFMEAMASGCPVVITDLPGNYDLVDNGKNGVIVQQKSVNALKTGIISLLENTHKRETLAREGRKKIQDAFSWNEISRKYCIVFNTIHEETQRMLKK